MSNPLVSLIVPTKNSAILIKDFLDSVVKQTYAPIEVIINDDVRSTDKTIDVINSFSSKGVTILYLRENISMAQGRLSAAKYAKGEIQIHLDSDMQLAPDLVAECVEKIHAGYDALVIQEESFGIGFWARCKWLEKKCYEGNSNIESLRCIRREVYEAVGGHDPDLVFSEDKDLDLRIREAEYRVGRTTHKILHNEGDLKLLKTLRKKSSYANSANAFAKIHPEAFAWQSSPLNRYMLFAKHYTYFFQYPFTYIGMIFMKTSEYIAAGIGMAQAKGLTKV